MMSLVEKYADGLLKKDRYFEQFWKCQSTEQRDDYIDRWRKLEFFANKSKRELEDQHLAAHARTKRWLCLVQESVFMYSRVPNHWGLVADDREIQRRIYERNLRRLRRLIERLGVNNKVRVYGGLKPYESIRRKMMESKDGNAIQRRVLDLWDLVRYRIVAEDLQILLRIGVGIWQDRFEDVIRCRNYYYHPRGGDPSDAYRAIHFELQDSQEDIIEVHLYD